MTGLPHVLLVGANNDFAGRLFGVPAAVSAVLWPGMDDGFIRGAVLETASCDLSDPDSMLSCIREIHRRRHVDAVLGLTERALHPLAVVAEALGIRTNPAETLALVQDKAAMRRRLAAAGIDTTAHALCTTPQQAREFALACPDGAVLKPPRGNGGAGIALVRQPEDLDSAWDWTSTAPEVLSTAWPFPTVVPPDGAVLVEEYLAGDEFSVETLSADGRHRVLAVTGKHTMGPPHFFETGHDMPARVDSATSTAIGDAVIAALDAIGLRWGPCHTEVVLRGERVAIVEFNARVGGAQIWEMVTHVTGTDLIASSVTALAYGDLPPAAPPRAGSAVRLLVASPGRVRAVCGVERARATAGVVRVGGLPRVGAVVQPLTHGNHRAGYVLAVGRDAGEAAAAAEQAAASIVVDTVPVDPSSG